MAQKYQSKGKIIGFILWAQIFLLHILVRVYLSLLSKEPLSPKEGQPQIQHLDSHAAPSLCLDKSSLSFSNFLY